MNKSESQFSDNVIKFFRDKIGSLYPNLYVDERVNIVNNFTFGKINGAWKLLAGALEQDIVIYKEVMPLKEFQSAHIIIPRKSGVAKSLNRRSDTMGPIRDSIVIPLAVLELKVDTSLNTHAFITYGTIASWLKSLYPHLWYGFAVYNHSGRSVQEDSRRLYSKPFNGFYTNWDQDKEKIWDDIKSHLEHHQKTKTF